MADQITFKMSTDDWKYARSNYEGFCLACGEQELHGFEPDARGRECPNCGENKAVGAEYLIVMDIVEFTDDE